MQTTLYMLTETSPYLLGIVIVTEKGNCVVIDFGVKEHYVSAFGTQEVLL